MLKSMGGGGGVEIENKGNEKWRVSGGKGNNTKVMI